MAESWPGALGSAHPLLYLGILLGAICAATAPAAIIGVVHEYRARGPMTTVLLGTITLDDGITLVLFRAAAGFARNLGGEDVSLLKAGLVQPGGEIMLALVVGAAAGLLLKGFVPVIRRRGGSWHSLSGPYSSQAAPLSPSTRPPCWPA